ncbi:MULTISPECIES: ABC transporter permease subunit [Halorussus]|uniref:ABC transporter permease subunit n=1 Tax=Halorussus TaxID=1070314 RepID=UPI00209FD77D|nr:ABC transporter permease subunit [Halorussus vallis]USZ76497.1 ABC transporter permease [Halorussus vallis]
MGFAAVVRKEFLDSVRSYSLFGLALLFALFAAGLAAMEFVPVGYRDSHVDTSTLALLNSMRQPTVFFVPWIGLGMGYNAIAGDHESGRLRLLLGLPNSRAAVVVGKFVGRTAVVAVSILAGYAVAGIVALATFDSFDFVIFGAFTALTVLYGAVYVGIAVGFSAWLKTREWALVGATSLYALFLLGWDVVLLVLQLAIFGREVPEAGLPDWFPFLGLLNPSTAFMHAARAVIPAYREITFYPEADAFYLQDWVGFAVLALWCLGALGLGYRRFRGADLN